MTVLSEDSDEPSRHTHPRKKARLSRHVGAEYKVITSNPAYLNSYMETGEFNPVNKNPFNGVFRHSYSYTVTFCAAQPKFKLQNRMYVINVFFQNPVFPQISTQGASMAAPWGARTRPTPVWTATTSMPRPHRDLGNTSFKKKKRKLQYIFV